MSAATHPARPTEIHAVLKSQYRQALAMLRQAIERCPQALWLSGEGHACPYWRIAFHALFFTHYYLQKDEHSLRRWPGHRDELQDTEGPSTDQPYTAAEMLEYLDFCLAMLDGCIDGMDLGSGNCGFHWYSQGKLEHQINNIRHVQHHAAQLGDRLRSATGAGLDWR